MNRSSEVPPVPSGDTTGGCLIYLGKRTTAESILGDSKLTITNLSGTFPDRQIFAAINRPDEPRQSAHSSPLRPSWLRLDVAPAITLH
jgi:hypothetical protein